MPDVVATVRTVDDSSKKMEGIENAVRGTSASYKDLNDALVKLAQQEKSNKVLDEAKKKFETLTQAEKDNLLATKNIENANAKTGVSFTELNSAIMLGQRALQLLEQGYDATIGKSQAYAEQVQRQVALS